MQEAQTLAASAARETADTAAMFGGRAMSPRTNWAKGICGSQMKKPSATHGSPYPPRSTRRFLGQESYWCARGAGVGWEDRNRGSFGVQAAARRKVRKFKSVKDM